jgi:ribosome modulation factor
MKKHFLSLLLAASILFLPACSIYTQDDLDAVIAEYEDKLEDQQSVYEGMIDDLKADHEDKLERAKSKAYLDGMDAGIELGHTTGYEDGLAASGDAYELGYKDGLGKSEETYNRGYKDGLGDSEEAYKRGYNDGIASVKTQSSTKTSGGTTTPPPAEDPPKSYTVYITKTGEKYHASGCQYLAKSKIAIDKAKAISQGYTACSRCKP